MRTRLKLDRGRRHGDIPYRDARVRRDTLDLRKRAGNILAGRHGKPHARNALRLAFVSGDRGLRLLHERRLARKRVRFAKLLAPQGLHATISRLDKIKKADERGHDEEEGEEHAH